MRMHNILLCQVQIDIMLNDPNLSSFLSILLLSFFLSAWGNPGNTNKRQTVAEHYIRVYDPCTQSQALGNFPALGFFMCQSCCMHVILQKVCRGRCPQRPAKVPNCTESEGLMQRSGRCGQRPLQEVAYVHASAVHSV